MKRVHGTIVRHIVVEETAYKANAYCDECLGEQKLRPRPEEPRVNDEYEVKIADDDVLDMMRNAIPGVVRDTACRRRSSATAAAGATAGWTSGRRCRAMDEATGGWKAVIDAGRLLASHNGTRRRRRIADGGLLLEADGGVEPPAESPVGYPRGQPAD